ncbi:MAG: hypothetical protein WBB70_17035 [Desulfobacterales bacterium]
MKYKFLCILLIVSVIFGCTKSQIKDSLKTHSRSNQYTSATIFPINPKDKDFAECLQRELIEDIPNLKFIPEVKFRDALFPWFEPNTAPKSIEELSALLSKTLVKKRIESLGVELLIFVHGRTEQKEYDGFLLHLATPFAYGGSYGYLSAERGTNITTTVWNLKESFSIGDTDIHAKGKVRWIGLILPVPIPAFTESEACSETAKRISNCITGQGQVTDK